MDENWYIAKDKYGEKGIIPANYVRKKIGSGSELWFVGDLMKHAIKEGTNVVALYSFRAIESASDKLSFEKGDEFTILGHAEEGWYLAKDKDGRPIMKDVYSLIGGNPCEPGDL
ncbi:tyrosine- kinase Tec isoform X1 [Paramuricea clavata]|uniref:Tyrosine- kinase Tec isoform X1 n=1 Tax=Paramuricea clavata TaxID=317549 RepID=A0A7D9EDQ2_PARCT|nr:tyrosine- kinase Tec isoform X1 [Paramuricea clavata]